MSRFHLMKFVARRLFVVIVFVVVIACVNFLLLHAMPGDLADTMAGASGAATPEYISQLKKEFGLDQPLNVQLFKYIKNVVSLNLGYSYRLNMPVSRAIITHVGPTLILLGTALLGAVLFGVLLGLWSAMRRDGWIDTIITTVSLIVFSAPIFWTGLLLIILFASTLGVLPFGGFNTVGIHKEGLVKVFDVGRHLVLPAATLMTYFCAIYIRVMRASALQVINKQYIMTARAKGLREKKIIFRHVLKNAMLPVITMIGLQIGALIGGSILVETVFSWPGLGYLAYTSVLHRDVNMLLGIMFVSAIVVLVANIVVDVVYMIVDPRIQIK